MVIRASRNPWRELAVVIGGPVGQDMCVTLCAIVLTVNSTRSLPANQSDFFSRFHPLTCPLPKTRNGYTYVLVCVDYATRWVVVKAVPSTATLSVKDFLLNQVLWQHGTPRKLIGDRGSGFTAEQLEDVLKALGMQHAMVAAYHPQTNGLCEKTNRTVSGILKSLTVGKDARWDEYVQQAAFIYNTAKHATTGFTPFELVTGRQAVLPEETLYPWADEPSESLTDFLKRIAQDRAEAADRTRVKQLHQADYYNKKRTPAPDYKIGDLVLVRRDQQVAGKCRKFSPKYIGPLQITKRLTNVTFRVADLLGRHTRKRLTIFPAYVSQLKPYRVERGWLPLQQRSL